MRSDRPTNPLTPLWLCLWLGGGVAGIGGASSLGDRAKAAATAEARERQEAGERSIGAASQLPPSSTSAGSDGIFWPMLLRRLESAAARLGLAALAGAGGVVMAVVAEYEGRVFNPWYAQLLSLTCFLIAFGVLCSAVVAFLRPVGAGLTPKATCEAFYKAVLGSWPNYPAAFVCLVESGRTGCGGYSSFRDHWVAVRADLTRAGVWNKGKLSLAVSESDGSGSEESKVACSVTISFSDESNNVNSVVQGVTLVNTGPRWLLTQGTWSSAPLRTVAASGQTQETLP